MVKPGRQGKDRDEISNARKEKEDKATKAHNKLIADYGENHNINILDQYKDFVAEDGKRENLLHMIIAEVEETDFHESNAEGADSDDQDESDMEDTVMGSPGHKTGHVELRDEAINSDSEEQSDPNTHWKKIFKEVTLRAPDLLNSPNDSQKKPLHFAVDHEKKKFEVILWLLELTFDDATLKRLNPSFCGVPQGKECSVMELDSTQRLIFEASRNRLADKESSKASSDIYPSKDHKIKAPIEPLGNDHHRCVHYALKEPPNWFEEVKTSNETICNAILDLLKRKETLIFHQLIRRYDEDLIKEIFVKLVEFCVRMRNFESPAPNNAEDNNKKAQNAGLKSLINQTNPQGTTLLHIGVSRLLQAALADSKRTGNLRQMIELVIKRCPESIYDIYDGKTPYSSLVEGNQPRTKDITEIQELFKTYCIGDKSKRRGEKIKYLYPSGPGIPNRIKGGRFVSYTFILPTNTRQNETLNLI
jgi:hypothetical protein